MNEHHRLWRAVLGDMQAALPRVEFYIWFENTAIVTRDATSVSIRVPNGFVKEWLQAKFARSILASLQKREPAIEEIRYVIVREPDTWRMKLARPIYRFASFVAGSAR